MSDKQNKMADDNDVFAGQIGAKAARKQRALRAGDQGIWFGLGMSGLIGWSVAVPTLLGASCGLWLDSRHSQAFSWTLALLFAGLALGCFNAWYWVAQQQASMSAEDETHD